MRKRFAIGGLAWLAAVCAASPVSRAAAPALPYQWQPVAIGGGGYITGHDADASGTTRVARSDVYGAYLWQPQADRWAQLVTAASMPPVDRTQNGVNEGAFEVVVAPSDPNRIYMALKGGVYRSKDRGQTFERTNLNPAPPLTFDANGPSRTRGPFMAVDPADADLLLFGCPGCGTFRTEDAGGTWRRASIGGEPGGPAAPQETTLAWFQPGAGRARVIAMRAGHRPQVSTDRGLSFHDLGAPADASPRSARQGAFAPDGSFYVIDADSNAVWRLHGERWVRTSLTTGLAGRTFASVAVNPRNAQVYVFDEGGRAFRSRDEGRTWTELRHSARVGKGDPPWLRVADQSYFPISRVTFDAKRADRLWAGSGTGIFYADVTEAADQIVWTSESRGIEELVANDVVQPRGRPPVFAAADFGIHVKSQLDRFSTTYGPKERVLISAQQVAWSASDPDFLVTNASDDRTGCCAEDGDAVLAGYSRDGGAHWQKFASLPTPPGTNASDPWRMAFGTIAVSAGDTKNIVWMPSFDRAPFYTLDRGETWARVAFPGETLPFTGSHSSQYLQRKTLAADGLRPGVFYLLHSGNATNPQLAGLWVTEDGGANWRRRVAGELAPQGQYAAKLRAVPGRAGDLFYTSAVADAQAPLMRSTDAGKTWKALPGIGQVDDVAFGMAKDAAAGPAIYISGKVSGAYGVWRSTDDATTWLRIAEFPLGTLDQVTVMEADKNVFGKVYLGYKGSGWVYGVPQRLEH